MVACLLTAALAVPAWGDTLIFRNGARLSGTLTSGEYLFHHLHDRNGNAHHYSVRDVDSVQFGDAPDHRRCAASVRAPSDAGYNQPRMAVPMIVGTRMTELRKPNSPDNQGNQKIQDNQNSQDNQV